MPQGCWPHMEQAAQSATPRVKAALARTPSINALAKLAAGDMNPMAQTHPTSTSRNGQVRRQSRRKEMRVIFG